MLEVEIMAKMTDLVYSMFDAASTVASGVDKYTQKQAELSTRTKSYQLKADIDGELARIRQSSTSDKWNEEINGFFENLKSQMSNPESPYYCKNNLQAEQFNALLGQSQVDVSNHVNNMVMQRQREERIVAAQNSKAQIAQDYSGQEYIDRCNDIDRLLFEGGDITPLEYQQQKDINFSTGYRKMHTDVFDASFTTALQQGKSKEAYWEDIKNAVPQLKASDIKGLEKVVDTKSMDEDLKKQAYQYYSARLSDVQQSNANTLSEIYQKMQQQQSTEAKMNVILEGQRAMRGMLGLQLSENDRVRYANYFKLEEAAITGSRASAQSAMSKLDPKDKVAYYINSWKNGSLSEEGGPTSAYNAYQLLKNEMTNEAKAINPNATWEDVKKACPTVMEFFDVAKKEMKNIPGMKDILSNAEEMLGVIADATKDKEGFADFTGQAMDIVHDMLMEVDVSRLDKATVDAYVKRTAIAFNSLCGGVLEKQKNYKWLEDEEGNITALRDYKVGVFGNEATMAKALQERENNPDLVYKDSRQKITEAYGEDIGKGLTSLEAAEKDEIASYLKYNSNLNISKADIKGDYEEDGTYDVKANKIYTVVARDKNGQPVDEYQYKFSSDDGKHVTMQRKKKGETKWETVKTSKQQEKYDSPRETAKRAVQDIDVSTVPPFEVPATGVMPKVKYTQKEWNEMNNVQKKNIIMSLLQKYPEEMQSWLDKQPDKSKKK